MSDQQRFPSLSAAYYELASLKAVVQQCSRDIFALKQNLSLSDEDFDEQRLALNARRRTAEDQIPAVEAWIEEEKERREQRKNAASGGTKEERIAAEMARQQAAAEAKNKRAALRVEELRLQAEIEKQKVVHAEVSAEAARQKTVRHLDKMNAEREQFRVGLKLAVKSLLDYPMQHAQALDRIRKAFPGLVEYVKEHGADDLNFVVE